MRSLLLPTLAAVVFSNPASASDDWPDLFASAVAAPIGETALYSYERVSRDSERIERFRYAYDPIAPKGNQFTLLTVPDEWSEEQRADAKARLEADGDAIWCDDLETRVKGEVTKAAENEGHVTFTFDPTNPKAEGPQKKVIERSVATLVVDAETERVVSLQYHLPKPFKPMIVAKVNRFSMFGQCTPTSQGRSYFSSIKTDLSFSAMGNTEEQITEQAVENLKLVRAVGE